MRFFFFFWREGASGIHSCKICAVVLHDVFSLYVNGYFISLLSPLSTCFKIHHTAVCASKLFPLSVCHHMQPSIFLLSVSGMDSQHASDSPPPRKNEHPRHPCSPTLCKTVWALLWALSAPWDVDQKHTCYRTRVLFLLDQELIFSSPEHYVTLFSWPSHTRVRGTHVLCQQLAWFSSLIIGLTGIKCHHAVLTSTMTDALQHLFRCCELLGFLFYKLPGDVSCSFSYWDYSLFFLIFSSVNSL